MRRFVGAIGIWCRIMVSAFLEVSFLVVVVVGRGGC